MSSIANVGHRTLRSGSSTLRGLSCGASSQHLVRSCACGGPNGFAPTAAIISAEPHWFWNLMASLQVQCTGNRPGDRAMTQSDTRSLQEIRRDTERTRAGLTNTVEELRTSVTETANDIRERIRPEAIKAEVSDYIRSRGEQLMDDITAAARKNPLQAVAVATTLGYPLLRMVRAIPVPILMVGAGLFLAGSKTAKAATQQASDFAVDMSGEAMRRGQQLRDEMGERASAAKSYATEQLDRLSGAVSSGTDRLGRGASDAGRTLSSGADQFQGAASSVGASVADQAAGLADRAAGLKDQGLRMAASAADAAREAAADAAATGKRFASDARDRSFEAVRAARDTASDLGSRAGSTVVQTIE